MSHFTVMIQVPKTEVSVGEYVARVLAPYDENKQVTPYISKPAQEVRAEFEENKAKYPEDYANSTLEEYADDWYGGKLDKDGNLLSTYNPLSKWDWYSIGGRWDGMIIDKGRNRVNAAKIRDIDFDAILRADREARARAWDESRDKGDVMQKLLYGISAETKEEHVAGASSITTYAVITKGKQWVAKGEMGWFGMGTDTSDDNKIWAENFHKSFIEPLDQDDVIVIVDCHI